jgi:hypothetical protein
MASRVVDRVMKPERELDFRRPLGKRARFIEALQAFVEMA